jgi:hypothetical protein
MKGANLRVAPVALSVAPDRPKAAESLALRAATGANRASHPVALEVRTYPSQSYRL